MEVFILALVGAFVVLVMGAAAASDKERKRQAGEIAKELGLEVVGSDELVGLYRGVAVKQYSHDHGGSNATVWWTYTRCTLTSALPAGMIVANQGLFGHIADLFGGVDIQLGNAMDPDLRIHGDNESEVRELLLDEDVHAALWSILGDKGKIELRDDFVLVRVVGRHTDAAKVRLDQAVRLVDALHNAGPGRWLSLAAARGFEVDGDGSLVYGLVGEVAVEIALVGGRTLVSGRLLSPLPQGTRLAHKDFGKGNLRLGDPVMDGMLSVETSDLPALAERIAGDAVRAPLLEVVHGHPGSTVLSDRVGLTAPGRLTRGLERALDSVVELVLAIA